MILAILFSLMNAVSKFVKMSMSDRSYLNLGHVR